MRRDRRLTSACTRTAVVVLFLLRGVVPFSQVVTEPALKAAFIYSFAKFTEWPDDVLPGRTPVVMCVLGDPAIADALERHVKGRDRGGHPIAVLRVTAEASLRGCHILYMSHIPAAQAAQIAARLRDAPVLTISDIEGFGALGGIAQFYFEQGNLKFSVEVEASKHARLVISSELLRSSKRP